MSRDNFQPPSMSERKYGVSAELVHSFLNHQRQRPRMAADQINPLGHTGDLLSLQIGGEIVPDSALGRFSLRLDETSESIEIYERVPGSAETQRERVCFQKVHLNRFTIIKLKEIAATACADPINRLTIKKKGSIWGSTLPLLRFSYCQSREDFRNFKDRLDTLQNQLYPVSPSASVSTNEPSLHQADDTDDDFLLVSVNMFSRLTGFSNMFTPGTNRQNNQPSPGAEIPHARNSRMAGSSRSSSPSFSSPKKQCHRSPSRGETSRKDSHLAQSCEVNNSSAVIAKIAVLYAERLMSDITLVINGLHYPTHRLILSASSDVFQVMLMSDTWSEAKEARVILQESPECAKIFECFLKYLYTGQVKLELLNVIHLLTLADKYNVKDLITICLEYMSNHIPAAAVHNQLIHWYQYTSNCAHVNVAESFRNFMKWNFEDIAKAEDFAFLDLELFSSILLDDDIVVFDEYTLYQCVDYWVSCQRSKFAPDDPDLEAKMQNIVKISMACVRFPMMSSRQIAEMLLSPLTVQYNEYLMDKMRTAIAFHSGMEEQMFETISEHPYPAKLFIPRLYSTDKWSVCMSVENFSSIQHYQSKTLVFSTPLSFSEKNEENPMEWVVDLYPKGVCFNKSLLIIWQGTMECPEYARKTVRLSVQCKSDDYTEVRVQIGILIAGYHDGLEHVRSVVKKNYIFSGRDKILNIDDLLPYGELIRCASCSVNNTPLNLSINQPPVSGESREKDCHCTSKSCFLVGQGHDSLKVRIVITPMSEFNV